MSDSGSDSEHRITRLLACWSAGDRGALNQLTPLVTEELRRLARAHFGREPEGHTLQPTALVNEVFLRFLGRRKVQWKNRGQFFQAATELMRFILVDHARRKGTAKRGAGVRTVSIEDTVIPEWMPDEVDMLALHQAMDKLDPVYRRIVELKFYFGLTHPQIAEELGIASDTVKEKWAAARARLYRELAKK